MKTDWTAEKLIEFEKDIADLFKDGKINCPIHLSGGNEEILLGIFSQVKAKDWVFSTHRNHYHYLLKGGSKKKLLDEILGKDTGICKGNGRSMHIFDIGINFYTSAIVGGNVGMAVGAALSIKKRHPKKNKVRPHVWVFVGDGAEDTGHYAEAIRFALARDLPMTFIVEDNDLAVESTKKERWHNYAGLKGKNIIKYSYIRKYPHVGMGRHVSM